jgi:peroxiredoxin
VTIVGVGLDDPDVNAEWAAEEGFPFELWRDDDATLGVTYGALTSTTDRSVSRITVILDESGTLVLEYLEDIQVGAHPGEVLDDCSLLFGP